MKNLTKELKRKVTTWVSNNFTQIDLDIVESYFRDKNVEIFDNISPIDPGSTLLDFLSNQDKNFIDEILIDINKKYETEYANIDDMLRNIDTEDLYNDLINNEYEYLFDKYDIDITDLEDQYQEFNSDNYPIWSTLFQINNTNYIKKEIVLKNNIGYLEGIENLDDCIFFRSAGHSFYSAYWIPLYLDVISQYDYMKDEYEKYKNVDYSGM